MKARVWAVHCSGLREDGRWWVFPPTAVLPRYSFLMSEESPGLTIRPAVPDDADGITRTYMESAAYHAGLDPERYDIPDAPAIAARYREGRQHSPQLQKPLNLQPATQPPPHIHPQLEPLPDFQRPPHPGAESVTLVAEISGEVVGFVDVRLDQSPDPMHRRITYCHVVELAISRRHQNHGIGGHLLRAAEEWGQRRGAHFAILEYLAGNQQAGELYQRKGYRVAALIAVKRLSAG